MSLQTTFFLTTHLLSFTLFLQAVEMLAISQDSSFLRVWNFQKPWLNLKLLSVAQIILAATCFFVPSGYIFLALFFTHLGMCVRFRGSFNGGSDMMTFVVLSGVLLGLFLPNVNSLKLGLSYIAIHTLYSYFKAGLVKSIRPEWRDGKAVPEFLQNSLLSDARRFGIYLSQTKHLSRMIGIFAVSFELSFPLILFFPKLVWIYFICALVFHFLIYLAFGLNRFFWIWLSAWPAAIYFTSNFRQL